MPGNWPRYWTAITASCCKAGSIARFGGARLIALSERLTEAGIAPYYLHLLDPVAGAAHYAVGPARATQLLKAMRARVSGYLVPRLAKEESGAPGKMLLPG